VTVEVLKVVLFKFLLKVNVGIFKIMKVQGEKRGDAGRRDPVGEITFLETIIIYLHNRLFNRLCDGCVSKKYELLC